MGVSSPGARNQIYTDSLQLSNVFLRRFVAESVLHLLLSPKNPSDLRESHDPIRPGQGGHVARAQPWLRYCLEKWKSVATECTVVSATDIDN